MIDLPGVGTKYEIETSEGKIAVVFLETGGIQLYVVEKGCERPCAVNLSPEEARRLGMILTGAVFEKFEESIEVALSSLAEVRIVVHTYRVPRKISGKSIRELEIRSKTGVTIIGISKKGKTIVNPSPDTVLEEDDVILVIGEKHQLEKFEEMIRE
ncbi:MAG: TrkA C-terminal domain-containing protein [Archaeoglobaceae archaeon]